MSENEAVQCKVVLIGESGVGKTSILNRFTSDIFYSSLKETPGGNYAIKTIYIKDFNKSIKFEIWDTAGQEKYRALAKVFSKNAEVTVFVYDITRSDSIKELKNYWIKEIKPVVSPNSSN